MSADSCYQCGTICLDERELRTVRIGEDIRRKWLCDRCFRHGKLGPEIAGMNRADRRKAMRKAKR